MIVLSIDCAGSGCGVCVWQDGRIVAVAREKMARGQDARLMPMIVDVMAQAGLDFAQIDRIAVTRGPGSFTGLRVGLAAARGVGLAAGKPVIGIDRFAIYRAARAQGDVLVVIDSKRADLFCQFFPAAGTADEPRLMTQKDIDIFAAAHPGVAIVGDIATPDIDEAALCAALAVRAETGHADFLPRPLYLRAPDVTLPGA
ncbi:MAG: tRNA (adenosine(37)-N6)-threonylcarbamoyltransferase complex dimerization subunit type 1 TsaB [Alphaproteobacteria bacterium]|nr:tRNA (adenosine(37)-N6)-threonylcarbamoyltransferase complex dimerization subunit type 1 TsaB [Alphaproteobacteria bacterium]